MSNYQPLDPDLQIDPFSVVSFTGNDAQTGLYLDADQENSSVLIKTSNTAAVYVDKFQNFGINTTNPTAQLDVNSSSGSCIQLTYNSSSTNKANIGVTSDGKLVLMAGGTEVNIDNTSNFNVKSHNGTTAGLFLANTLVRATADQLNFNVVTPGQASASKSIVLDNTKNIEGINSLSAAELVGTLQTSYQPLVTSVETLDVASHSGVAGLSLGGSLVTATAEKLNYVDTTPGTAAANKAVVLDGSRDISNLNRVTADQFVGTLQTAAQPNITSLGTLTGLAFNGPLTGLTQLSINTVETGRTLVLNDPTGNCLRMYYDSETSVANYADLLTDSFGNMLLTSSGGNVDVTTHDGASMGLSLGGILVKATADQLNYLYQSTPGVAVAGKAMVADSNRNIGNVNSFTATSMYGTLMTPAQPNIASVTALNIVAHDGANAGLKLNGTLVTATADELNYVDTNPGVAAASKAMVLNSSKDIAGIHSLTADELVGTLQTAAQPNVTSLGTLDSLAVAGDLTLGSTIISENELHVLDGVVPGTVSPSKVLVVDENKDLSELNSLTAVAITGEIQTSSQPKITSVTTLNITGANGSDAGLALDGEVVTATATELNYVDTTPGTAQVSKALVLDSNKTIAGIQSLSATELTGTLQTAAQPNVTSLGTLTSLAMVDNLTLGATTINEIEIKVLDDVVPGTVKASSAVVVDENKDISTFRKLTAVELTGEIQTASQPKITSVTELDVTSHDGATVGLKLGGVLLTATAPQINSIFGAGGTGTFNDLAVNHNLTIPNVDGSTQGLVLGETLLTSSGTELNYLDGSLPGTVVPSKAVVVDENKDIASFRNLTSTNLISSAGSLTMGATNINEAEIGVLDAVVPGTASASKALVVDSLKNIKAINSLMLGTSTDATRIMSAISGATAAGANTTLTLGTANSTYNQLEINFYQTTRDLVSNYASLGITGAGPTLYVSPLGNGSIGIGNSAPSYKFDVTGTGRFTGNLTLGSAATFTMNATTISEAEIGVLDGVTPGTVSASKALVVDASKNISKINSLSTSTLLGTQITLNSVLSSFGTWTGKTSALSNLTDIAYSSSLNMYIVSAGFNAGTSSYLYSTDGGSTWQTGTLPVTSAWGGVCWLQGANRFLMVSAWNDTAYSSNGINWTTGTCPVGPYRYRYIASYDAMVAIPFGGTTIAVCSNGIDWVSSYTRMGFGNNFVSERLAQIGPGYLTGIAYNANGGVALSYNNNPTSTFASHNQTVQLTVSGSYPIAAYSPTLDRLVVLASNATGGLAYMNNPTGSTLSNTANWNYRNLPVNGLWADCIWVSELNLFIALSYDGTSNLIQSSDGIVWTIVSGYAAVTRGLSLLYNSTTHSVFVVGATTTAGATVLSSATAVSAAPAQLTIGSTTIAESELATIDGVTPGTVAASKAVVVDANKDISSFRNLTATNLTGTLQTAAQPNIASVNVLDVTSHDGATVGLKLGGTLITASADEINFVDNVSPGTVAPLHAVVVDGNKDISSFRNLTSVTLTSTSGDLTMGGTNIIESEIAVLDNAMPGTASAFKALVLDEFSNISAINDLSSTNLTSTAGSLTMGATNINEAEIAVLDAAVPGTAAASKAVVLDEDANITSINDLSSSTLTSTAGSLTMGATNIIEDEIKVLDTVVPGIVLASHAVVVDENKDVSAFRKLTAVELTGTLQTPAQPNVTSVGTLDSLTVKSTGDIIMGNTTITEQDAIYLVDATPGAALASTAMVLDASKDISGIHSLSADELTGTIQTAAQPHISSVDVLDITEHDGTTQGLRLAGELLKATALQLNAIVDGTSATTFADATVTDDLTLSGHDGVANGLILGNTLVTALASELNYVDTTPGHAQASKALVFDENIDIDSINNLTANNLYGAIKTASQPDITSVSVLDVTAHDGETQGLKLGGVLLEATATEINSIFASSGPGGEGKFNNLTVNNTLTLTAPSLVLGETLLTASGIELNYLDGSTPGTATASNAVVLDANKDITGIHYLTAERLTGTLQTAAQPNVTSVGTLTSVAVAGDVTVGSTVISESDIAQIDGIVQGEVAPSKAVVVDANKNIGEFNTLTAVHLVSEDVAGTLLTAAQPNVTSVGELTSLEVAGDVNVGGTLTVGGTIISEAEIVAIDAATPGTALATKAMITDSNNSIGGINVLAATTLTGTLSTPAQPNVTSVGELTSLEVAGDVNVGGTLTVGGTIISESEIVAIDAATPGTALATKAMITDSNNSIGGINSLSATTLTGTLTTAAQPNIESVTILDVTAHDGEAGLSLGGVLVSATATELNYTDTTVGHAEASKALVLDANKDIDSIHNISLVGLTSETGAFTNTTDSSSPSTGAVTTLGGVGIAKNLNVGVDTAIGGTLGVTGATTLTGDATITSTTDTTSASTGAITTAGGVGIAKSLWVGANARVEGDALITGATTLTGTTSSNNTTDSSSTTSGAITTAGGVGIAKNLNVGVNAAIGGTLSITGNTTHTGTEVINNTTDSTSITTGSLVTAGGAGIAKNLNVGVNTSIGGTLSITGNTTHTGTEVINNTTDSTSITTGSLVTAGGAGIAKNLNVGGTLAVTGASTLTGNTSIGGTLAVTGASTFTGQMTANGGVNSSNLTLQGGGSVFSPSSITTTTRLSIPAGTTANYSLMAYDAYSGAILYVTGSTIAYSTNGFTTGSVLPISASVVNAINGYGLDTTIINCISTFNGTIYAGGTMRSLYSSASFLMKGTVAAGITSISFLGNGSGAYYWSMQLVAIKSSTELAAVLTQNGGNQLCYSTNGGSTFTSASGGGTHYTLTWVPTWNKYVDASSQGIKYSADGSTWTLVSSGIDFIGGISYNTYAGVGIAISDTSPSSIWYSTTGTTWTLATYPSTTGITFGAVVNSTCSPLFVVYPTFTSSIKTALYSTDGINWSTIAELTTMQTMSTLKPIYQMIGCVAVDPVTGYAYAYSYDGVGGFIKCGGSFKFSSNTFGLLVSASSYLQNKSGTGYEWYNDSLSASMGTKIMQLDSTALTLSSVEAISNTTDSTSTTTGSFTTAGGAGIAKNLNVGTNLAVGGTLALTGSSTQTGTLLVNNTTDSSSTSTGAITTAGGVGIAKNLNVGANTTMAGTLAISGNTSIAGATSSTNATQSTSTTTGAITTLGGVGISKNLNVGGDVAVTGASSLTGSVAIASTTESTSTTSGSLLTAGGAGISKNLNVGANASIGGTLSITGTSLLTGSVAIADETESTSITTGSLTTAGGAGIVKNLNVGGVTTITNTTASTSTSTGALVVAGGAGIASDLNVGGDVTIHGDSTLIGDFTLSGRLLSSNVNLAPDLSSPFSTLPLTAITATESILALNKDAGIAHIHSAGALVTVPELVTVESIVYYATNHETTWASLALMGDALVAYTTNYDGYSIKVNQVNVNAWSNVIWVAGSFSDTTANESVPFVLSGNLEDGMNALYIVGPVSNDSATAECICLAVATDDNNVAALRSEFGNTDLYYLNISLSSTFNSVATGSFASVAWLNGLGKFVATRADTSSIYVSTNVSGTTWVGATTPTDVAPNTVYFNDTFNLAVAVGADYLWYSTNGATWTPCTYPALGGSSTFNAVVNSPVSGLVAVYTKYGDSPKQVYYTVDGITWTATGLSTAFGHTTPCNSSVAFDASNYAYAISEFETNSTIQKIGPITSTSMTYKTTVVEGFMKSQSATGYQWFADSTPTESGNELMTLSASTLEVKPIIDLTNTTNSVSITTGSLVTDGGVGIAKNLNVGMDVAVGGTLSITGGFTQSGKLAVDNVTQSVSSSTGAITTLGGVGIAKNLNVGQATSIGSTLSVSGAATLSSDLAVGSIVDSTSPSTGSITTAGGVGIAQALNVGTTATVAGDVSIIGSTNMNGSLSIANTAQSTSSSTGAITTLGGVGIAKNLNVGENVAVSGTLSITGTSSLVGMTTITNVTDATSSTSGGALTIAGGAAVAKSLFVGSDASITGNLLVDGTISFANPTDSTTTASGSLVLSGGVGIAKALNVGTTATIGGALTVDGLFDITNVTDAASVSTGSFTTAGGVGIAKSLYVGTGIYGTIMTANQPNITQVTTLDITGATAGTAGLRLNGELITTTATELNYLDGSFPGLATAGNALVLDDAKNISGIHALTADELTGTLMTGAQPNITSLNTVDIVDQLLLAGTPLTATAEQINSIFGTGGTGTFTNLTVNSMLTLAGADGASVGLVLGTKLVTANADELNYLDGVTPGTATMGNALVLDVLGNIEGINLLSATSLEGTLMTSYQPNLESVDVLDITGHNGADAGLKLNGDLVTATATEINYVDTTVGIAQPEKALVLNSNKDITGINSLSATSLTGTLQTAAQPNVTSVGTLTSLAVAGDVTIGSTVISQTDIAKLDNITNGTAAADKALVLDADRNIANINSLSSNVLSIGTPNNVDLPIECGSKPYLFSGAYAYSNYANAHGLVDTGMGSSQQYSARFDGRVLCTGEVQITSDRRLKQNIIELDTDFAKSFIMKTTPVKFNWRTDDEMTDYGYIAQDVLKQGFEDLVSVTPYPGMEGSTDDDGFINPQDGRFVFSPGKIIPMLALNQRSVFEQLEEKDAKIASLEERLDALEAIIKKLA